ncbi:hypothetical protein IC620_09545 [Hazenella sp. IB182357]|uniref:Uncharacterized protein n=1 Tax=Polycladospora coralii TaxID=2771432 RepID=A0A926NAN8_9BACL|nr:hypothetical protein [Polycladospora coralii]MBD1372597.1 hypothetical protein [Polycladospora coralii]
MNPSYIQSDKQGSEGDLLKLDEMAIDEMKVCVFQEAHDLNVIGTVDQET